MAEEIKKKSAPKKEGKPAADVAEKKGVPAAAPETAAIAEVPATVAAPTAADRCGVVVAGVDAQDRIGIQDVVEVRRGLDLPPLLDGEHLGQAEVLIDGWRAKLIVRWQNHLRDGCARRALSGPVAGPSPRGVHLSA